MLVTLDAGETLADLKGPTEIILRCDPEEPRFAALLVEARKMTELFEGKQP